MSPDPTNAERQQRWRNRRKAGQAAPACACGCGRKAYGEHAPLARRCWLATDAGREWNRLRIAGLRASRRNR